MAWNMRSAKNVRESFTDNVFIYQVNNSLIFVIFAKKEGFRDIKVTFKDKVSQVNLAILETQEVQEGPKDPEAKKTPEDLFNHLIDSEW